MSLQLTFAERIHQLIRYFDLFDHPLRFDELAGLLQASPEQLLHALQTLITQGLLKESEKHYFTPAKQASVSRRLAGEKTFRQNQSKIRRVGWILSHFPFVRGILLTGTASKEILDTSDDFDFMILVQPGRLWLCRTLITLWRKLISFNYRYPVFKYFCCNFFLGLENTALPDRNEFIALELAFAKPVYHLAHYRQFLETNAWSREFYQPLPIAAKLLVKHRLPGLRLLGETLFNLFWNPSLEKRLQEYHFQHWQRNNSLATRQEFAQRASLSFIKNDTGGRQAFLLFQFHDFKSAEPRSRLRTKWMLQRCTGSDSTQKPRADILFTHAYYLSKTRQDRKINKPYVPLGPLAVARYLQDHGFNAAFLDTTFLKGPGSFIRTLQQLQVPIIGIYIMETTRQNALRMITLCRALGLVVLVGGPDPSNEPQFYLDHGAHLTAVGEGEETLAELLEQFQHPTRSLQSIPGLYTGSETVFLRRNYIENIDSLPQPARDLVDFAPYFRLWKKQHHFSSMLITASRGCPYPCTWCSKPVFGSSHRQRGAGSVVAEMKFLQDTYHPDQLWFTDDIFALSLDWLREFHAEVLQQQVKIKFECLSRVDLANPERIALLKEAGCFRIWYGAESGSQKILDKMKKRFQVAQIQTAAALTRQAGLEVGFFIMLAYPGETLADIEATRALLRATVPDFCGISIAYPFRGTPLYEEVKASMQTLPYGRRFENDNRVIFHAAHPQWFYYLVRRLLGREVYVLRHPQPGLLSRAKLKVLNVLYEVGKNV